MQNRNFLSIWNCFLVVCLILKCISLNILYPDALFWNVNIPYLCDHLQDLSSNFSLSQVSTIIYLKSYLLLSPNGAVDDGRSSRSWIIVPVRIRWCRNLKTHVLKTSLSFCYPLPPYWCYSFRVHRCPIEISRGRSSRGWENRSFPPPAKPHNQSFIIPPSRLPSHPIIHGYFHISRRCIKLMKNVHHRFASEGVYFRAFYDIF